MEQILSKIKPLLPTAFIWLNKFKFLLLFIVVAGASGFTYLQLEVLSSDIAADETRLQEGQVELLSASSVISDELIDLLNQRSSPGYPLDSIITSDNNPFDQQQNRSEEPLNIIFNTGSDELIKQLQELRNESEQEN